MRIPYMLKSNPITRKRLRYITVLSVVVLLAVHGVTYLKNTAESSFKSSSVVHQARLFSLSSELQNIQRPGIINPGQTSGNIDGIVSSYKQQAEIAQSAHIESPPFYTRVVGQAKFDQYNSNRANTNTVYNDYATVMQQWQTWLSTSKKFLEYNASNDLAYSAPRTGPEPEQITRTIEGIEDTISELDKINLPIASKTKQELQDLLDNHQTKLTESDVDNWSSEVLKTQNTVLTAAEEEWQLLVDYHSIQARELARDWTKN